MYLLALTLILAGLFIYASHRKEWLVGYLIYNLFLYFFMYSLEGFLKADLEDRGALSIFMVFETIVYLLHIPLILRLSQYRPKDERVKNARQIFETDVAHLSDHKLHHHLGHK